MKMNSYRHFLRTGAAFSLLLAGASLRADVTLAPLFQDNAVLQQGKPIPVWGKADAGEKVTVEFKGQKKESTAAADGRWAVSLDALPASAEGKEMVVTGKNTIRLNDILVGEVWICSGQSNMAFRVSLAKDAETEMAKATDGLIRQFKVELKAADAPSDTANGAWAACSPSTVKDFTAVGYFFARDIRRSLNVPVGLINTSYGGTPVESWMSEAALKSNPAFASTYERWKKALEAYPAAQKVYDERFPKWLADRNSARLAKAEFTAKPPRKPDGPGSRMTPSGLFNAMVYPLIPYAVRGVLWYQGEANASRSEEYRALFPAMISQWRKDFGQGELPFYFVQLANLERKSDPSDSQWAFQREAQACALQLPHTGMATAADVGDPINIHPKNKQEVGRRLALIALALTYEKGGEYAGPVFKSAKAEGAAMQVAFTHAGGLKMLDGAPGAFEVAGADKKFHPATAKIEGDSLVVSAADVSSPVAVRYGWRNNPALNLYNGADLPAFPFRSDDWPQPEQTRAARDTTPEAE